MGHLFSLQRLLVAGPWIVAACISGCTSQSIDIDSDDIGGVVTSADGPEAGVWVIAETDAFQTRYAKIVVTDDQGRYVVPDLPDADYEVWVRGYGLADSEKVSARPGQAVDLTAVVAPSAEVAAEVYPAISWYSMMNLPEESEVSFLPGGLNEYISILTNQQCVGCHQLGQKSTRTFPESLMAIEDSQARWMRRVQASQAAHQMIAPLAGTLRGVPFKYLADWTDRVAAGELPTFIPERPQGIERNIVATVRDWGDSQHYLHDLISTDRRDPTVNPYGEIYGAPELSTDDFPILDPVANTDRTFLAPVRDADTPTTNSDPIGAPSAYWGTERIWDSKANAHNPMLDQDGRVWYTATNQSAEQPGFLPGEFRPTFGTGSRPSIAPDGICRSTSPTPANTRSSIRVSRRIICSSPRMRTTRCGPAAAATSIGWLNTDVFMETKDAKRAQGWTAAILDINGNGKRDEGYSDMGAPIDPTKDARINPNFYAVMPNPADGSVWGSTGFEFPGRLVRIDPGANPPATALAEQYSIPLPGFASRGADIDRNGVVWVSLGSGHLGEFDRQQVHSDR